VPGFARADCHGDGTPIRPGASGTKPAADVPQACRCTRRSPLICERRSPAVSGSREPALPRMQGPCPAAQRHPEHADPARPGRPAGRCGGGCGAQSCHIKVRSVFCDRADSVRAQQVAVAGPRIPQGCTGRTIRLAVQVPFEDQREQVGVDGEVADRGAPADLAEPDRTEVAKLGPTRRGRRGSTSRSASRLCPVPAGRVTFRVHERCDAPVLRYTDRQSSWPPAARKSAKCAESPPTFAS